MHVGSVPAGYESMYNEIFTPDAICFVAELYEQFVDDIEEVTSACMIQT